MSGCVQTARLYNSEHRIVCSDRCENLRSSVGRCFPLDEGMNSVVVSLGGIHYIMYPQRSTPSNFPMDNKSSPPLL